MCVCVCMFALVRTLCMPAPVWVCVSANAHIIWQNQQLLSASAIPLHQDFLSCGGNIWTNRCCVTQTSLSGIIHSAAARLSEQALITLRTGTDNSVHCFTALRGTDAANAVLNQVPASCLAAHGWRLLEPLMQERGILYGWWQNWSIFLYVLVCGCFIQLIVFVFVFFFSLYIYIRVCIFINYGHLK